MKDTNSNWIRLSWKKVGDPQAHQSEFESLYKHPGTGKFCLAKRQDYKLSIIEQSERQAFDWLLQSGAMPNFERFLLEHFDHSLVREFREAIIDSESDWVERTYTSEVTNGADEYVEAYKEPFEVAALWRDRQKHGEAENEPQQAKEQKMTEPTDQVSKSKLKHRRII